MKIFIASAFSKDNKGGNLAGVCLYGEGLNAQQKQAIAKELGLSETVYISGGEKELFKLEYFTPAEEVPLCGHATIAAFVVMQDKLTLKKKYSIETKSGILGISLDGTSVFMEQNSPEFYEVLTKSDVMGCFSSDVTSDVLPIEIGSTGLRDIMLPVKSLAALDAMEPDFEAISEVSRRFGAVGIHAFALEGGRIVCRNFAPLYDIPEESATGTSNCVLACYLWKNNVLRQSEYVFEQGYSLGSPSEITVRLNTAGEDIEGVSVGGCGYVVDERVVDV
ncbi:MAG: PhzF family phenazine biosynthesis protein [Oscillospiraceae bacterium]|nr:PhzF family phenazine biosynthesis protein [Oscillospiraceae bacterium]